MATFMDLSLFEHFAGVFVFLMVFVMTYGSLSIIKLFKGLSGEKGLYAIIALAIAFFASMSQDAFSVIVTMTPWFTILIVFLFLIFFVVRMWAGDDDKMFPNLIKKNGGIQWVLIIVFIIIIIGSISSTFGQRLLDDNAEIQAIQGNEVTFTDGTVLSVEEAQDAGFEVGTTMNARVTTTYTTAEGDVSSQSASTATDDFSGNVMATIIHPKVLGMILFMIIGFLTIIFLAKSSNPEQG